MPKLRRMRLVSIGHDSARFPDVTLKFIGRDDKATNSVIWLRNGGGKTSLLSLFFAGVRPNKREFLGQRADEKVRSIDDYVGRRDHALVVCEWELDSEKSLFDDEAPRFLTGVFYEWANSQSDNGKSGVDRLFFCSLNSSTVSELTLDDLPILTQGQDQQHRRTLAGFRRTLNTLAGKHPQLGVFHTDKQHKFEEELASRGIDPEVFYYQIRMNEREGGVSERFSFAEDEEFIDFLLEMAFSQRRAQEVREQLTTFRQELVERNEQLKPELQLCEGLTTRLRKLAGIHRDREIVFQETATSRLRLQGLRSWVTDRLHSLGAELTELDSQIRAAQIEANNSRAHADESFRRAAVYARRARQIQYDAIDAEYNAAAAAHNEAKRVRDIWTAACPLARAWEAQRRATMFRQQLAIKQQQFAPDLERLRSVATRLANALDFRANVSRKQEQEHQGEAERLATQAKRLNDDAQTVLEQAIKKEAFAKGVREKLATADAEVARLREQHVLLESESAETCKKRLQVAIKSTDDEISRLDTTIQRKTNEQRQITDQLTAAQKAAHVAEHQVQLLDRELSSADSERSALETDAALVRLLQVNEVDVESAAAGAVDAASEELRRITETVLRIRIESAEDERAIDWLKGDGELLPPSSDVRTTLLWLQDNGITAWSGWEYIERNTTAEDRRSVAQRLPFVVTGIVVANHDYERVVELVEHSDDALTLRSALTIVPAEATTDANALIWTVVGPTSDAHFDKNAAALELNRLEASKKARDEEIRRYQHWHEQLTALREKLRAFQQRYPFGWFARHRQKRDAANARFNESRVEVKRIESLLGDIHNSLNAANELRDECKSRRHTDRLHLERIDSFIRQHGSHIEEWAHQRDEAERAAAKLRASHLRVKKQTEEALEAAKSREASARNCAASAADDEKEISRLTHVDEAQRKRESGQIDSIRADYSLLRDDYDNKVGADSLEQRARDKDDDAEMELREFERILGQYPEIEASDVERELAAAADGLSATETAEHADKAERAAVLKLGPLKTSRDARESEFNEAKQQCEELVRTGDLPDVKLFDSFDRNDEEAKKLKADTDDHLQLAAEFEAEVDRLDGSRKRAANEVDSLKKDEQRLTGMITSYGDVFQRLEREKAESESNANDSTVHVKDADDLARQIVSLESALQTHRSRHSELDEQRETHVESVRQWSRDKRFSELPTSVSHRFDNKRSELLEGKAQFFITQLEDMILEIERKLEEADKHHDRVVNIVASAVEDGLSLLKQVQRMSRLPDSLPQAGKHYLKIETKASDNPVERRGRVADLINELLKTGNVGDGLALIQKAVRRVAVHTRVRVLHPDLQSAQRLNISAMRGKSGGERLTCAILLYCALVRLRQLNSGKKGSSVLFLDNPIGTASRVSFLDLQREVAASMNVQLIYATGVKDLNAVGALENVIRLRNSRVDRRSGRRVVEFEGDGAWIGQISAARIAFDSPPGSVVGRVDEAAMTESEAADHAGDT